MFNTYYNGYNPFLVHQVNAFENLAHQVHSFCNTIHLDVESIFNRLIYCNDYPHVQFFSHDFQPFHQVQRDSKCFVTRHDKAITPVMQETMYKVGHCVFTWKGNTEFAHIFHTHLDNLKKQEKLNLCRHKIFVQIHEGKNLVNIASKAYLTIGNTFQSLHNRINDLNKQESSLKRNNTLRVLNNSENELRSCILPKELTRSSVAGYTEKAARVTSRIHKILQREFTQTSCEDDVKQSHYGDEAKLELPAQTISMSIVPYIPQSSESPNILKNDVPDTSFKPSENIGMSQKLLAEIHEELISSAPSRKDYLIAILSTPLSFNALKELIKESPSAPSLLIKLASIETFLLADRSKNTRSLEWLSEKERKFRASENNEMGDKFKEFITKFKKFNDENSPFNKLSILGLNDYKVKINKLKDKINKEVNKTVPARQ